MSGIPLTGGMRQAVIKIGRNAEAEFSLLAADGFSSGVLIKVSPDGEQYKIGTYRS